MSTFLSRRALIWTIGIAMLFGVYVWGLTGNPPGFYVDESGLSYNAYLISKTGAGEFGARWPLFFQIFTGGFTQYSNPTQIYLLAAVFWLFGPSILAARLAAAASVFGASLLLGLLAGRVSGKREIGFILGALALVTPWLFEVSRLALETFFYPMAVVLFLWSVHMANRKERWSWLNITAIAFALTLLTYSYTIGRLLGPLLAFGLISFAFERKNIFAVVKTWVLYAITLIPLISFGRNNPGLTTRFYLLSYIKPESSYFEIIYQFIIRFFEDLNPVRMLFTGDTNPRHHIPDALGSIYIGVFLLALLGSIIIVLHKRYDAWWRLIAFGLAASVVPGALTVDKFHTLRMIAFPIFALMLTVPALEWLLNDGELADDAADEDNSSKPVNKNFLTLHTRKLILGFVLIFVTFEASYFHWKYYHEGGKRGYVFDAAYKQLYDEATAQPNRPIYLIDNYWGPAYIHSFWYATVEGRSTDEFIHLPYGKPAPAGGVVISTERDCSGCQMIDRSGDYILYISTREK